MYLLMLMTLPVVIGIISWWFFRDRLTWREFLMTEVIVFVVLSIGYLIAGNRSTSDIEIWNGRIVERNRQEVNCSHSYPCNCHIEYSGVGKNQTSQTVCATCYEHPYDVDWDLVTNNREEIEIPREDAQGLIMPARWAAAYKGEPTSIAHPFVNYVKANPTSILVTQSADPELLKKVPDYPNHIYDYYRCDHFLSVGVNVQGSKEWQWLLAQTNADLGAMKQVNIIVLVVNTPDSDYQYAVEKKWLGGKKNDVIVLIGCPNYPEIAWVRVVSWTQAEALRVYLRDGIMDIGDLGQRDAIIAVIRKQVQTAFQRRHMKSLKYLMAQYEPGRTVTLILLVLSLLLTVGLLIVFDQHPVVTKSNWRDDYR